MDGDRLSNEAHRHARLYLKPHPQAIKTALTWQMIGVVAGLAGGIIAVIFGTVFTAIAWLSSRSHYAAYLQRYGTILLFLTIPLLIFGAHCLDLLESKKSKVSVPVEAQDGKPDANASPRANEHQDLHLLTAISAPFFLALLLTQPTPIHARQLLFNVPSILVRSASCERLFRSFARQQQHHQWQLLLLRGSRFQFQLTKRGHHGDGIQTSISR